MTKTKILTVFFLAFAVLGAGKDKTTTKSKPSKTQTANKVGLEELRAIQQKIKAHEHLSVEFDQVQYRALHKRERTSKGRARFSKPDKFHWTLLSPVQDQWIYDGQVLYNYDPEAKSAVRYAATGAKARDLNQIVDLVLNLDSLLKRYDLVEATREGDLVKVELAPKVKGDVTAVDLHISTKEAYIPYLKLYLPDGNTTTLLFKNPSRAAIPASAYALPQGVKVTESL